jgi:hypothetical protein
MKLRPLLSRGFLRVDIEGLPPMLNDELKKDIENQRKRFDVALLRGHMHQTRVMN